MIAVCLVTGKMNVHRVSLIPEKLITSILMEHVRICKRFTRFR